ncbi:MAG: hypothetical protein IKK46_02400 [Clostridia bacterium]|nr:hypothetical protein [Clostridia bacterium]
MVNIWEFLLQTISVSLVAGLILIVKNIFKDKLTPRWQYGIWVLLILRIFLPVKADKFVLLPFGIYLEMIKNYIENFLSSAYTQPLTATDVSSVVPYFSSAPKSITDVLFVIYVLGIVVCLCHYFFSYIKLRLVLKKGNDISAEKRIALQHILSENKIKKIKVISVKGINSAFICGIFSPVLALPSERETDEKILLHEMMHLKHLDSLQNLLWCFLRCLHWCNPFMHYIFNIVGNDMEMLCDQRVLEKLEGEERREYGVLLLNEVNQKYARMPGTTSVSNGGKNISKRIEAIARFKKYPEGMALVSICIAILLSFPCLFVSAGFSADSTTIYWLPRNEYEYQKALAYTRLNRPTTIAGAIDTYAKALMEDNSIMLLAASPEEKHQDIIKNLYSYYNDIDIYASEGRPFSVFNLTKTADEKYSAVLIFSIYEEDVEGYSEEEEYGFGDTLFVPIEIFKENNFWVVRETGERKKSKSYLDAAPLVQINCLEEDAPILFEDTMQGENGTLWVKASSVYTIAYDSEDSQNTTFLSNGTNYNNNINLSRDFSDCLIETNYIYTYEDEDYKNVRHVSIEYTADPDAEFEAEGGSSLNFSSSSTDGSGRSSHSVNSGREWDRTININDTDSNYDYKKLMEGYNSTRKLAVYVDGKLVDTFTVEVNTNGN